MMNRRRIAALLCALFLFAFSAGAVSHEELLFIAAEDMVLPLSDDMAFFYQGYLYLSSDFFTGAARDALGVGVARIGDSILVYRGEQSLLFRGHYSYAQDSEQNTYAPGMILREENAYVPAAMVARYFDLLYSTTDVEHGKLIWLRKPSFPMKEKAFAKAAAAQLNIVYQEYLKASEPEPAPPEEPEAQEDFSDFSAPEAVTAPETDFAPVTPSVSDPVTPPSKSVAPDFDSATTPSAPDSNSVTPSVSAQTPKSLTPSAPVTPSVSDPVTPPSKPAAPDSYSATTPSVSAQTPKSLTPSAPVTPSVSDPITPPSKSAAPDFDSATTPSAPDPVTPDNVSAPPDSEPAPRDEQTIYLCLRADDNASALLDALDRHHLRATLFCDETFLAEQGDLLRRVTATGYRVGLYLPSGSTASVLARLETCNLLLQRTTMEKTRLVFADGAGEETLRAIRNAGFVCLLPDTKLDGASLRTSRQAADFLKRVPPDSDAVAVWLDGTVSASGLNAFVNQALNLDDAFLPWTEAASA